MTTRVTDLFLQGALVDRPDPADVPDGCLFSCGDGTIYKSDLSTWNAWASLTGGGGSGADGTQMFFAGHGDPQTRTTPVFNVDTPNDAVYMDLDADGLNLYTWQEQWPAETELGLDTPWQFVDASGGDPVDLSDGLQINDVLSCSSVGASSCQTNGPIVAPGYLMRPLIDMTTVESAFTTQVGVSLQRNETGPAKPDLVQFSINPLSIFYAYLIVVNNPEAAGLPPGRLVTVSQFPVVSRRSPDTWVTILADGESGASPTIVPGTVTPEAFFAARDAYAAQLLNLYPDLDLDKRDEMYLGITSVPDCAMSVSNGNYSLESVFPHVAVDLGVIRSNLASIEARLTALEGGTP